MPDALPSLLSRIEAATGPDREIDAAVCDVLGGHRSVIHDETGWRSIPAAFSGSCDAVLALIERELPGWVVGSIHQRDPLMAGPDETSPWGAVLASPEMRGGPEPWSEDRAVAVGEGANPALAALAALIRAKIAQDGGSPCLTPTCRHAAMT